MENVLKEPTIVVQLQNQGTMDSFAPIFIKTLDDAILACGDNEDLLHQLYLRAASAKTTIKGKLDAIFARKNGYKIIYKGMEDLEAA